MSYKICKIQCESKYTSMLNFQNIYPDIFGPYLKDEEASFEIHNLGQRINEFYKLTYRNSYKEIDCRSDRIILRMEEYDRDFLNANSQIKIYLNILEKLKDTPLFGKVRLSLMAIWAFYKLDTHLSEITNLFKDYYLSSDPVIYGQSLSDVMLAVEKDVNDDLHKFEIGPYTPDKDFFRFNLEKIILKMIIKGRKWVVLVLSGCDSQRYC